MSKNVELKPINEAQKEAEKFFEREDVQAIFKEAFTLATVSLPNYQLNKAEWADMYNEPYPSKQKRDDLFELERDLHCVACALNRRVKRFTFKQHE